MLRCFGVLIFKKKSLPMQYVETASRGFMFETVETMYLVVFEVTKMLPPRILFCWDVEFTWEMKRRRRKKKGVCYYKNCIFLALASTLMLVDSCCYIRSQFGNYCTEFTKSQELFSVYEMKCNFLLPLESLSAFPFAPSVIDKRME